MRNAITRLAAATVAAQGLAGVACISVGVGLVAGLGPALITLGAVLLFATWSRA